MRLFTQIFGKLAIFANFHLNTASLESPRLAKYKKNFSKFFSTLPQNDSLFGMLYHF